MYDAGRVRQGCNEMVCAWQAGCRVGLASKLLIGAGASLIGEIMTSTREATEDAAPKVKDGSPKTQHIQLMASAYRYGSSKVPDTS